MKSSKLLDQSLDFSVYIVEYYKFLVYEMKEFVMSKQILRSGTSIGANINEAQYAISKADFICKFHISLKETSETIYWLKLLSKTGYLPDKYKFLLKKCHALEYMLVASLNTAKIRNVEN